MGNSETFKLQTKERTIKYQSVDNFSLTQSPKIRSVPTRNSGGTLQEALKFSGRDVSIVWDGKEIGT